MKVKIFATGYGATALRNGHILHFDISEKAAKKPDKRKLEAEVDIEDARRIRDLGWGDFKEPDEVEPDLEVGQRPEKASQPAADRVAKMNAARAKKAAEKKRNVAASQSSPPANEPPPPPSEGQDPADLVNTPPA